jgi:hypothetical protein
VEHVKSFEKVALPREHNNSKQATNEQKELMDFYLGNLNWGTRGNIYGT